jgi:hypothetical protein
MSVLSLFKKPKLPEDGWRPADAAYPSLFDLAGHGAALDGKGGIYAVWHLGVRPQWLRIGAGANLLECLTAAAAAPQMSTYRGNGGVFAAWSLPDAARRPGIVLHLRTRLEPVLQHLALPGENTPDQTSTPILFPLPPGTTER